jgi:hypothetical protein
LILVDFSQFSLSKNRFLEIAGIIYPKITVQNGNEYKQDKEKDQDRLSANTLRNLNRL